jgi:hypothetical protein
MDILYWPVEPLSLSEGLTNVVAHDMVPRFSDP